MNCNLKSKISPVCCFPTIVFCITISFTTRPPAPTTPLTFSTIPLWQTFYLPTILLPSPPFLILSFSTSSSSSQPDLFLPSIPLFLLLVPSLSTFSLTGLICFLYWTSEFGKVHVLLRYQGRFHMKAITNGTFIEWTKLFKRYQPEAPCIGPSRSLYPWLQWQCSTSWCSRIQPFRSCPHYWTLLNGRQFFFILDCNESYCIGCKRFCRGWVMIRLHDSITS